MDPVEHTIRLLEAAARALRTLAGEMVINAFARQFADQLVWTAVQMEVRAGRLRAGRTLNGENGQQLPSPPKGGPGDDQPPDPPPHCDECDDRDQT